MAGDEYLPEPAEGRDEVILLLHREPRHRGRAGQLRRDGVLLRQRRLLLRREEVRAAAALPQLLGDDRPPPVEEVLEARRPGALAAPPQLRARSTRKHPSSRRRRRRVALGRTTRQKGSRPSAGQAMRQSWLMSAVSWIEALFRSSSLNLSLSR